MRGILRFIPWWIFVLPILVTILWLSRIHIIEQITAKTLKIFQIEETEYDIQSFNFSNLTFAYANSRLTTSAYDVNITTHDLKLSYTVESLYKGEVDLVDITKATIDLRGLEFAKSEKSAHSPMSLDTYLTAVFAAFDQQIPVKQVTVGELSITQNGESIGQLSPLAVSGKFDSNHASIQVTHSLWVLLVTKRDNQFDVTLNLHDNSAVIDGEFTISDPHRETDSIEGDLRIDFEKLESIELPPITQSIFPGHLQTRFSIVRKDGIDEIKVNSESSIDRVNYQGFTASNLTLSANFTSPIEIQTEVEQIIQFEDIELNMDKMQRMSNEINLVTAQVP